MCGAPSQAVGEGRRVLLVWPPHVPSYFNAGHHIPLFQVGAYLRGRAGVAEVRCVDAGAAMLTWKEVGDLLSAQFDVIGVMNEFDAIEGIGRFVEYARAISPAARLITFGRLSAQIPRFFERYGFDAIVHSGDYEAGVTGFLGWLDGGKSDVPGVALRVSGTWVPPARKGVLLPPEDWAMPDIREIPYEAHDRLYRDDGNKFCGIPERRELVVPVARGCPVQCHFCEVPRREGTRARHLPVPAVVRYIEESFAAAPFEYVAMYAPTFTLDRRWVEELCEALIARGARHPWKCTTTPAHLDEGLVRLMARSGCVRISIGLETLDPGAHPTLPGLKRTREAEFDALAAWCREAGVELNCFVILGLPGTSVEGSRHTVARVRASGARVRPTIYTPYHLLRDDMDEKAVSAFNRHLFVDGVMPEDAAQLYRLYFGPEPAPTRVMERVPKVPSAPPAGTPDPSA